jgi:predicted MPP superfamily phosphohydrolase
MMMKLETGYNNSFEIRKEYCDSECTEDFKVLYLSDLHLNRFSKAITTAICEAIGRLDPCIIFLGGDYLDSKAGVPYLEMLLGSLENRNVFAIAGNHDHYFGIKRIRTLMEVGNVIWIEGKSHNVTLKNNVVRIDGNTISNEPHDADFSILLLHKPLNIKKFYSNYNLAFAGHLHGGQLVLWRHGHRLYPGSFFYKENILEAELSGCKYFISKGLGDTLPLRYNCKKDLIYTEVKANNNNKNMQQ